MSEYLRPIKNGPDPTEDDIDQSTPGEETVTEKCIDRDEKHVETENNNLVSKTTDHTEDTGTSSSDGVDHDTAVDNTDNLAVNHQTLISPIHRTTTILFERGIVSLLPRLSYIFHELDIFYVNEITIFQTIL